MPSFALVMATGIVSIAAHLLGVDVVDVALLVVNVVAYVVLWAMTAARLARDPAAFGRELSDHRAAPALLTVVAGTCVLGNQMVLIADSVPLAEALLIFGAALWLVLTYTMFTALIVKPEKPRPEDAVNGGWLLAVVATQSVAVLIALLEGHWGRQLRFDADFVAVALWLVGGMLYIWIAGLILRRLVFERIAPADLAPSYWIDMGAMAISTLAGSLLIGDAADSAPLDALKPFIAGVTVLYWATATWWIPLLVILGIWRHVVRRVPIAYDPLYWSAVFPLGMYAAATLKMADALSLDFLDPAAHVVFWIALAAWLATFTGLARGVRGAPSPR
jgi:tellurite resistance protein TehA-like permease